MAECYTTVTRDIPDLLIIFLLYFGGSSALTLLASLFWHNGFIDFPGYIAGVIAVDISSGA
ncbi:MAG: hypothetical protein ACSLEN_03600 [Candidatus Malihini olakiniferum]